ncbi:MAG: Panacea domain-containing protein, partial [Spirochaetota bacterium]|nr:Panacea domain-containing protein [Spirochaetota bacterium]
MSKAMDSIQKSELNVRTFLGLIIFFSKFTKYLNKTKLNKLMFFTDFGYYSKTKEKITSARYIHMPFG